MGVISGLMLVLWGKLANSAGGGGGGGAPAHARGAPALSGATSAYSLLGDDEEDGDKTGANGGGRGWESDGDDTAFGGAGDAGPSGFEAAGAGAGPAVGGKRCYSLSFAFQEAGSEGLEMSRVGGGTGDATTHGSGEEDEEPSSSSPCTTAAAPLFKPLPKGPDPPPGGQAPPGTRAAYFPGGSVPLLAPPEGGFPDRYVRMIPAGGMFGGGGGGGVGARPPPPAVSGSPTLRMAPPPAAAAAGFGLGDVQAGRLLPGPGGR